MSQIRLTDLEPDADDSPDDKPSRKTARSSAKSAKEDRDLKNRLTACFERVADALDTRGDEELADLVRADTDIMSNGLVSLTRPLQALRTPLVLVISVIEPALAFGRILRVLAGRMAERRMMNAAAQEEAAREAAEQQQ